MNADATPETARALLWRHGLPEDVIDGALCLHAQELAAVQRAHAAQVERHSGDDQLSASAVTGMRAVADFIDPTHPEGPAAGGVVSAAPDQADVAARRERYAQAIHDAMEPDLSLVDQEPGCQALFARAAEAASALADTELAGLRRKLAASERIRENADFHLGQEMARRQSAEKETARLSADRAAVLNAAAQHLYTALFPAVYADMGQKAAEGVNRAVSELRRLAAEAQPAPCRNCRGSGLDPRYNGEFACPDCTPRAEAQQQPDTETRCTCADAGAAFAPAGHYADCPQGAAPAVVAEQPAAADNGEEAGA